MSSYCQPESFVRQDATITTEKPLWGSKREQDWKKSLWQNLRKSRQSCNRLRIGYRHTHSKLSPIARGERRLLCIGYLNVPLSGTVCCKDKGYRDGNVNLSNHETPTPLCQRYLLHKHVWNVAFYPKHYLCDRPESVFVSACWSSLLLLPPSI